MTGRKEVMTRDTRFVEVYETHVRRVYAYCRRRTDSTRADDAVAEVFLTAWRKIDAVPEGGDALLWLYAVAHKVISHHRRSSRRRNRLEMKLNSIGVGPLPPIDDLVVRRDDAERALLAASRLREKDQEVLRLAIWEELSHAEIAEVIGSTPGAVKQRLFRARQALAREFTRLEKKTRHSPAAQEGGTW